ncbi:MAG: cyclic nucleotide-binding domain-containing protein [Gammaproteobacteria bacterium]
MSNIELYQQRIETLDPLLRLTTAERDMLLQRAQLQVRGAGEIVCREADSQLYVHYLLDGTVDLMRDGRVLRTLSSDEEPARRPLDEDAPAVVRARMAAVVLRLPRAQMDRLVAPPGRTTSGTGAAPDSDTASHWMSNLLRSGIYPRLPASNLQLLFSRMEPVAIRANDIIIHQGAPGDYYYVVKSGSVAIIREGSDSRGRIQLAVLGPGDSFGEEALISGQPRNATVRALGDCTLMRLARREFMELICRPLMQALDPEQARLAVRRGARWLDIRYQEAHARGAPTDALNVPLAVLRIKRRALDPGTHYVVCGDEPAMSAVGAFLLAESGLEASYLDAPVSMPAASAALPGQAPKVLSFPSRLPPTTDAAHPADKTKDNAVNTDELDSTIRHFGPAQQPASESIPPPGAASEPAAAPSPAPDLGETVTGRTLANLIGQIDAQRREILSEQRTPGGNGAAPAAEADPLDKTHNTLRRLVDTAVEAEIAGQPPVAAAPAQAGVDDEIGAFARDFQQRVAAWVQQQTASQRSQLEAEFEARTSRIKDAAVHEIRRNAQELKKRYLAAYADKERKLIERERQLQSNYDRLMALATRISRQKAEIGQQRKLLEEKLGAADELHRQLADIGKAVTTQIDNLEVMVQEVS